MRARPRLGCEIPGGRRVGQHGSLVIRRTRAPDSPAPRLAPASPAPRLAPALRAPRLAPALRAHPKQAPSRRSATKDQRPATSDQRSGIGDRDSPGSSTGADSSADPMPACITGRPLLNRRFHGQAGSSATRRCSSTDRPGRAGTPELRERLSADGQQAALRWLALKGAGSTTAEVPSNAKPAVPRSAHLVVIGRGAVTSQSLWTPGDSVPSARRIQRSDSSAPVVQVTWRADFKRSMYVGGRRRHQAK